MTVVKTLTLNQHVWQRWTVAKVVPATTADPVFQNPRHWRISLQKTSQNRQNIGQIGSRKTENPKIGKYYKPKKSITQGSDDM
jgi:hypothetical protein